MNPEEYIIIKKSELQEFVNKITLDNKELPEFISGIYALNNYINGKISNPLQPLLEETFEAGRKFEGPDFDENEVVSWQEIEESIGFEVWQKYSNFKDFIKQKEI